MGHHCTDNRTNGDAAHAAAGACENRCGVKPGPRSMAGANPRARAMDGRDDRPECKARHVGHNPPIQARRRSAMGDDDVIMATGMRMHRASRLGARKTEHERSIRLARSGFARGTGTRRPGQSHDRRAPRFGPHALRNGISARADRGPVFANGPAPKSGMHRGHRGRTWRSEGCSR